MTGALINAFRQYVLSTDTGASANPFYPQHAHVFALFTPPIAGTKDCRPALPEGVAMRIVSNFCPYQSDMPMRYRQLD